MADDRPSPERPPARHREMVVGLGAAVALVAMLFAPLWLIMLLLVAASAWLVGWTVRADRLRLVNERGRPRLWLFGLGGAAVAANLTTLRFMETAGTGRVPLILSLLLIVLAVLIGLVRAARHYPDR